MTTGARVRNAYATYPQLGDSPEKFGLIPIMQGYHLVLFAKDLLVVDGHASD